MYAQDPPTGVDRHLSSLELEQTHRRKRGVESRDFHICGPRMSQWVRYYLSGWKQSLVVANSVAKMAANAPVLPKSFDRAPLNLSFRRRVKSMLVNVTAVRAVREDKIGLPNTHQDKQGQV